MYLFLLFFVFFTPGVVDLVNNFLDFHR